MKTFRFVVHGRVQGVFFRAATRQQATVLGVTGWVRNLPDGNVEGMVSGSDALLEGFRRWLERGPEQARVLKLEWLAVEKQEFSGFTIR